MAPIHNLRAHIVSMAMNNPRKEILLVCDSKGVVSKTITREELSQRIEAGVAYLYARGLASGDRVALAFHNSAELLILSWAAWSCGIVTVPLDTKRDTGELYQYKIKSSGAKLLIVQKEILKNMNTSFLKECPVVEFSEFPEHGDSAVAWSPGVSHLALILFTSGTTSHPKGAKLTLENLLVNAESIREWLRIGEKDRFLVELPLHHINSTTFCLTILLAGGSIAIPPVYSNSHFWEQAANTKATFTSIVQSILFDQLQRTDEYAGVKDRLVLSRIQIGSAPITALSAQEFIRAFGIPLYQGYGQTETALRVTGVPMELSPALYEQIVTENSIGTPLSWAEVRIADEKGDFLGENQEGELVVRGPAVMAGYVGDEPAFRDGYFLTGDIGRYRSIEGRRFFFLSGRKSELIIKGGINISPVAVEHALQRICPDIDQTYVIGIADERYGEELCAFVIWKKEIEKKSALRRLKFLLLAGSPLLSRYETPKYISVLCSEDLPVTSTGKVQRAILKKRVRPDQCDSIYDFLKTSRYQFSFLTAQSPYFNASLALYNHCWQPLTIDSTTYKENLSGQFVLIAIDAEKHLAGQIAFTRTDTQISCVSICSATYRPKPVPHVEKVPSSQEVGEYLRAGHDGVYNFHRDLGAELVAVTPGGRPEDASSLGYTMLLSYPPRALPAQIPDDEPVSRQLMHAVLRIAKDIGINEVFALSRPGGLASYVAKQAHPTA